MEVFLELVRDIWDFLKVRKKILVGSTYNYHSAYGGFDSIYSRICRRTIHIFNFLKKIILKLIKSFSLVGIDYRKS